MAAIEFQVVHTRKQARPRKDVALLEPSPWDDYGWRCTFHLLVAKGDALAHVLGVLKAPSALRTGVEKLYGYAASGEYGLGLSKKQARAINVLAEALVDPLVEYIKAFASGHRPRSSTRSRPAAEPKQR